MRSNRGIALIVRGNVADIALNDRLNGPGANLAVVAIRNGWVAARENISTRSSRTTAESCRGTPANAWSKKSDRAPRNSAWANGSRRVCRNARKCHQVGKGARVGVHGSLDRQDDVRRTLYLVDDWSNFGVEGRGVIESNEGDGLDLPRQCGLSRLPGAAEQHHSGIGQSLSDPTKRGYMRLFRTATI